MSAEKLSQAIQLIKAGNKTAALPILKDIVQKEPTNENAWLWLYSCVEGVAQKKYCLQKAININPNNQNAKKALINLEGQEIPKTQATDLKTKSSSPTSTNHYSQNEKQNNKKTSTILQFLAIIGLLSIGIACVAVIFIFVSNNTGLLANLPVVSNAKFESVTGSPKFVPPNINDPMIEDSTIQITVNYPTEMAQGDTVNITITCVNNSDKPIDQFGVSFDGIPTAPFRNNVNYFNGISVISTDPQLTEAFPDSSGNLHFHFGKLNPKETKTVSLNVTANFGGVYLGGAYVTIEQGDLFGGYDATFTTTVK